MAWIAATGISACWLALLGYWVWTARGVKPATRTEHWGRRWAVYWVPILIAMGLLGPGYWFGHTVLRERFVPRADWVLWLGLALAVAGLALAVWARSTLGRNWSGEVQIKQDHELVADGAYSLIRHPIYSGILLIMCGSALRVGEWRGVLAVVIVAVSFWFKLQQEERWLRELFGETYAAYHRRTKALIPYIL